MCGHWKVPSCIRAKTRRWQSDENHCTSRRVNTFTKRIYRSHTFSPQIIETNCNFISTSIQRHCRCRGQRTTLILTNQKNTRCHHSRTFKKDLKRHQLQMTQISTFVAGDSRSRHLAELLPVQSHCSLCALGLGYQARLMLESFQKGIDLDKFRFVKAENDHKISLFVQAGVIHVTHILYATRQSIH